MEIKPTSPIYHFMESDDSANTNPHSESINQDAATKETENMANEASQKTNEIQTVALSQIKKNKKRKTTDVSNINNSNNNNNNNTNNSTQENQVLTLPWFQEDFQAERWTLQMTPNDDTYEIPSSYLSVKNLNIEGSWKENQNKHVALYGAGEEKRSSAVSQIYMSCLGYVFHSRRINELHKPASIEHLTLDDAIAVMRELDKDGIKDLIEVHSATVQEKMMTNPENLFIYLEHGCQPFFEKIWFETLENLTWIKTQARQIFSLFCDVMEDIEKDEGFLEANSKKSELEAKPEKSELEEEIFNEYFELDRDSKKLVKKKRILPANNSYQKLQLLRIMLDKLFPHVVCEEPIDRRIAKWFLVLNPPCVSYAGHVCNPSGKDARLITMVVNMLERYSSEEKNEKIYVTLLKMFVLNGLQEFGKPELLNNIDKEIEISSPLVKHSLYFIKARIQAQRNLLKEAIESLNHALECYRYDAALWTYLGHLYYYISGSIQERSQKAIEAFSTALEIDPSHIVARNRRCFHYLQIGKMKEATEDFEAMRGDYTAYYLYISFKQTELTNNSLNSVTAWSDIDLTHDVGDDLLKVNTAYFPDHENVCYFLYRKFIQLALAQEDWERVNDLYFVLDHTTTLFKSRASNPAGRKKSVDEILAEVRVLNYIKTGEYQLALDILNSSQEQDINGTSKDDGVSPEIALLRGQVRSIYKLYCSVQLDLWIEAKEILQTLTSAYSKFSQLNEEIMTPSKKEELCTILEKMIEEMKRGFQRTRKVDFLQLSFTYPGLFNKLLTDSK